MFVHLFSKPEVFSPPALNIMNNQVATGITVIVPTRNEAGNVHALLARLQKALAEIPAQVIFVDDSEDETPEVIRSAACQYPPLNVQMIHRKEKDRAGGLGSAVLAGMRAAMTDWVCVMDGDLQHPPELIPALYQKAVENHYDLVAASRREEQSNANGLNALRNLISKVLDRSARLLFYKQLKGVNDPLTGFFILRLSAVHLDRLKPNGFKILLEILIRNENLKKSEIPFQFGARHAGKSKASPQEVLNYFQLLFNLRFGSGAFQFLVFALIGLSGILVNTLAMAAATQELHIYYLYSAALATVVSSTWNFTLTDRLVFQKSSNRHKWMIRYALFLVINSLVLVFRVPVLYLFTAIAGMHYLVSNAISIVTFTILRYLFSDHIIWKKMEPMASPQVRSDNILMTETNTHIQRRKNMESLYYYNIHNILSIQSEAVLPELEPFLVRKLEERANIFVKIGTPNRKASHGRHLLYTEILGNLGFATSIEINDDIEVIASPMLRSSPHVLYTNVIEPILRWTFVEKGYALVHGATIAFGDKAYLITARTDTGKTTTLLKILNHQRRCSDTASFISDDMTLVSRDGRAMTYPKPLTISHHTLRAVNSEVLTFSERLALVFQSRLHSRSGRKLALLLSKTHLPMATVNTIIQWLVPPPKYAVQRLIPKVKLAHSAKLAGIFVIERGQELIDPIPNNAALEILLNNCEDAYGFPPYDSIKEVLYHPENNDLRQIEESIIREAFNKLPATLIRSTNLEWWRKIPVFVDQQLAIHFADRREELQPGPVTS